MADRNLGYDIDVDYDGAQAAQRALDDVKKLERGIDDIDRAAQGVGDTTSGIWDRATSSFVEFSSAIGIAQQAFGALQQAAEVAWETISRGADLQRTEEQASALAGSIGTSWETLSARMTDATGDMISQADLAASAVDIIGLGMADTGDEVVRLSKLVGELGWDMQTLTLTLANQSTARLDSLGLSMEDVTGRAKELEEAGLAADEAFKLSVIEAGEAKLDLLGSAAGTTAGQVKELTANWEDFQDTIAKRSAEAAAPLLGIATAEIKINEAIDAGIIKQGSLERAQAKALFTSATYEEVLADLIIEIERLEAAELDLQVYYETINNQRIQAIEEQRQGERDLADERRAAVDELRNTISGAQQDKIREGFTEARIETYAFKDSLYEVSEALTAEANAADAFAERVEAAATAAADAWAAYVIEAQTASGESFTGAAFAFDEEGFDPDDFRSIEEAIYRSAQAAGFGAGALSDLGVAYGLVSEEAAEFGENIAQQDAIIRTIESSFDASRDSILQYKVAIESANQALAQRQTPVDSFDASTFFDQGGDEVPGLDASPIVTSIRAAVGEARGIVEGFASPDDVYEAFVELNYDDVVSGASDAQTIIDGIEGRTIIIDLALAEGAAERIKDAIDEID